MAAFGNALSPVALVARFHLEWIVQKAEIFELGQLADFGEFAPVLKFSSLWLVDEFDMSLP